MLLKKPTPKLWPLKALRWLKKAPRWLKKVPIWLLTQLKALPTLLLTRLPTLKLLLLSNLALQHEIGGAAERLRPFFFVPLF